MKLQLDELIENFSQAPPVALTEAESSPGNLLPRAAALPPGVARAPSSNPRYAPTVREYVPPASNLPKQVSQRAILADNRTRGNIWPGGAQEAESDNDD
jgi:hypothetical protein